MRAELATTVEHAGAQLEQRLDLVLSAEAAAVAHDGRLAAQTAARLEPLAGRIAVSGISSVMGPVDGYLALALAVSGRRREAADAAARAERQSDEWGFAAYAAWLAVHRARLGF